MQIQLTFHTRGGSPENVHSGLVGNRAYIQSGLVLQRIDDETVHIHADMTSGVDVEELQSIVHGICDLIVTAALLDIPVQQRDEARVEVLTQIANHALHRLKGEAMKKSLAQISEVLLPRGFSTSPTIGPNNGTPAHQFPQENKKQEDHHE